MAGANIVSPSASERTLVLIQTKELDEIYRVAFDKITADVADLYQEQQTPLPQPLVAFMNWLKKAQANEKVAAMHKELKTSGDYDLYDKVRKEVIREGCRDPKSLYRVAFDKIIAETEKAFHEKKPPQPLPKPIIIFKNWLKKVQANEKVAEMHVNLRKTKDYDNYDRVRFNAVVEACGYKEFYLPTITGVKLADPKTGTEVEANTPLQPGETVSMTITGAEFPEDAEVVFRLGVADDTALVPAAVQRIDNQTISLEITVPANLTAEQLADPQRGVLVRSKAHPVELQTEYPNAFRLGTPAAEGSDALTKQLDPSCRDRKDNDEDGLVDTLDSDCLGDPAFSKEEPISAAEHNTRLLRQLNFSSTVSSGAIFAPSTAGPSRFWSPVYAELQPNLRIGAYAGNIRDIDPTNDYSFSLSFGAKSDPDLSTELSLRSLGEVEASYQTDNGAENTTVGGGARLRFWATRWFFADLAADLTYRITNYEHPNETYPTGMSIHWPIPTLALGSPFGTDGWATAQLNVGYDRSTIYADDPFNYVDGRRDIAHNTWGFPFTAVEHKIELGTSGRIALADRFGPEGEEDPVAAHYLNPNIMWQIKVVPWGKRDVPRSAPATVSLTSPSPDAYPTETAQEDLIGLDLAAEVSLPQIAVPLTVSGRYSQRDQGGWPLQQAGSAKIEADFSGVGTVALGVKHGANPAARYGGEYTLGTIAWTPGFLPEAINNIFTIDGSIGTINEGLGGTIQGTLTFPGPSF